jgi:imidazolonepropionase-like amidohydrolase
MRLAMRLRALRLIAGAASLCVAPNVGAQDSTIILAGRLLDPATGSIRRRQQILVVDGRVARVATTVPHSTSARVIDLSRLTVLPGLIDAHVHLTIGGTVRENALADLRAGFTTVVDLGARTTRLLRVRDSINAGQIPGPRVLAAGVWIGAKGGVCEFNGIGIAGGADAFVARVRENVGGGADVIKLCVSGWPAESYAHPDSVELPDSTIAAVVREAHAAHRLVIAHDISVGGVKAALRAGVDGLAHAAYVDAATAAPMRARGMFMIPTLASLTGGDGSAAARALPAATRAAANAGVTIVFGTDAGVLPHGRNAEEFLALRRAGLSTLETIRAATTNAARALRLSDSLGAIRAGLSADIIAVEGNPVADIGALTRVRFVMLRGRTVELPSTPAKTTSPARAARANRLTERRDP